MDAAEGRRRGADPGGPPLAGDFPDEWIEAAVAEAEDLIEGECGVAFTPRETTETVQAPAPGGLHRLILKPMVREVLSVEVDGSASDGWKIDKAAGILTLPYRAPADAQVEVTYQHGYDEPSPQLLKAVGIFIKRSAAAERSGANRDVRYATETAVVYTRPNPGTWQITGWDDFDAIVARLPHYRTPGIA